MGLDTSHDAWHGPYSSFNHFRRWLAQQIRVNLSEYEGYHSIKNGKYIETGTKKLDTIEHDIMPLLNHSDCDGELSPDECRQIARGLKQIIEKAIPDKHPFSSYQLAIRFRRGCILAANANESIDFH